MLSRLRRRGRRLFAGFLSMWLLTQGPLASAVSAPTIDSPPAGSQVGGDVTVSGTTDSGATVRVDLTDQQGGSVTQTVYADAYGRYAATLPTTALFDGPAQVVGVAYDVYGGWAASVPVQVYLSNPLPVPAITSPAAGSRVGATLTVAGTTYATYTSSLQVAVTARDGAGLQVSASAYAAADGSFNLTMDIGSLADGTVTVDAWTVDGTGRQSGPAAVTVEKQALWIDGPTVFPTPFSPVASSGMNDMTIAAAFSAPSDWTVRVKGAGGAIVREWRNPPRWEQLSPGTAPAARSGHALAAGGDGKLYLFGGNDGTSAWVDTSIFSTTWSFDPLTGQWTELAANDPGVRAFHTMATGGDGKVVIYGGTNPYSSGFLHDTKLFDPTTTTWTAWTDGCRTTCPDWPYPGRAGSALAAGGDGKLYFFGGVVMGSRSLYFPNDTFVFNPATQQWMPMSLPSSPAGRMGHAMAAGADGEVYLFGGKDLSRYFGDTWAFDPAAGNWTQLQVEVAPPARSGAAMARGGDGRLYLFGGSGSAYYNDTWVLAPGALDTAVNLTWDGRSATGSLVPDGAYAVEVTATDGAGHQATATVTVDNTAPATPTLEQPVPGSTVGPSVVVAGITEGLARLAAVLADASGGRLSAKAQADASGRFQVTMDAGTLAPGPATLTVFAIDAAGNTSVPARVNITLDREPLTVAVAAPAGGTVLAGAVTVTAEVYGADNAAVGFYLDDTRVGSAASRPYSVTFDTAAHADGSHRLRAVATDGAGRTATSEVAVAVDNRPPVVETVHHDSSRTFGEPVTVTAAIHDLGTSVVGASVYYRRLGQTTFSDVAMSQTAADSVYWQGVIAATDTAGDLDYYILARDATGNEGASPTGAPGGGLYPLSLSGLDLLAPEAGATVGEQVYAAGLARPGLAVQIALDDSGGHSAGTTVTADVYGQWRTWLDVSFMTSGPAGLTVTVLDGQGGVAASVYREVHLSIDEAANAEYRQTRNFGPVSWSFFADANVATGNLVHQATDFILPAGRGPSIDLTRTYNSHGQREGSFGPGWTLTYDLRLADEFPATGVDRLRVDYGDGRQVRFSPKEDGVYRSDDGDSSAIQREQDGSFTLKTLDEESYRFNSSGRLLSISDRSGNALNLGYDSSGRLIRLTDAVGRQVSPDRDGAGRVITIRLPGNVQMGYTYDASGRLGGYTDARGQTTTYTYDASGWLERITDPRGKTKSGSHTTPPAGS